MADCIAAYTVVGRTNPAYINASAEGEFVLVTIRTNSGDHATIQMHRQAWRRFVEDANAHRELFG